MIIFRPHRGSLADAMKEAKEFLDESVMKQYIVESWQGIGDNLFDVGDIVIKPDTHSDDRIGWRDVRYVCVKHIGKDLYDDPQCIGYCATEYNS